MLYKSIFYLKCFGSIKKCITFAAVNNFYSNEDEDSKEENTTATLREATHSLYWGINEYSTPLPMGICL